MASVAAKRNHILSVVRSTANLGGEVKPAQLERKVTPMAVGQSPPFVHKTMTIVYSTLLT